MAHGVLMVNEKIKSMYYLAKALRPVYLTEKGCVQEVENVMAIHCLSHLRLL